MDLLSKKTAKLSDATKSSAPPVKERNNIVEKINILEKEIASDCNTTTKNKYFLIALIAIPLILFVLLYMLSPSFIMKTENEKKMRDGSKLFMWTAGLTVLSWGGLYGYYKYKGIPICLSFK
jgi:hypothetical protein